MDRHYETQFKGQKGDASKAKLPPGYFTEDAGGDLSGLGVWRRRKGMTKTSIAKQSGPVTSIVGFSHGGGQFALMLATGGELHGFAL